MHNCFRISRRTALVKTFKDLEKFDESLEALPNDEEALERNNKIRHFCFSVCSGREKIAEHKNIQLHRHRNLVEAYEKMVMREVAVEQSNTVKTSSTK